jgi:hypothetical protein
MSPRFALMVGVVQTLCFPHQRHRFDAILHTMKKRLFALVVLLSFAAVFARAEVSIDTLLARASRDLKKAPQLVATTAVQNPKLLANIVTATVTAFPDKAPEIVAALLRAIPDRALDIVRTAIAAQPDMAVEIASIAVATLPDEAEAIKKTAVASAPDDLKGAVRDLNLGEAEEAYATPSSRPENRFPPQPVVPTTIVSSSSPKATTASPTPTPTPHS